jgi:hypothetical protein
MARMREWPERVAFRSGDRAFRWGEVFLFAHLRGEWEPFESRLREDLALLVRETSGGRAPEHPQLAEATAAFRQAWNLISADEAEAWLEGWGLEVETWQRVLYAQQLRAGSAAASHGAGNDLPSFGLR